MRRRGVGERGRERKERGEILNERKGEQRRGENVIRNPKAPRVK
jgi:hypothetical protein